MELLFVNLFIIEIQNQAVATFTKSFVALRCIAVYGIRPIHNGLRRYQEICKRQNQKPNTQNTLCAAGQLETKREGKRETVCECHHQYYLIMNENKFQSKYELRLIFMSSN